MVATPRGPRSVPELGELVGALVELAVGEGVAGAGHHHRGVVRALLRANVPGNVIDGSPPRILT